MISPEVKWRVTAASWLLAILVSGCAAPLPRSENTSSSGLEPRPRATSMRFLILNAEGEDVGNRYPSTLVVGRTPASCSGVLLHPHLVLTAAHCVCQPKRGQRRLDTKSCAKTTEVTAFTYVPKDGRYALDSQARQGVVRPHENFEALLDDDLAVTGSTSDLAVIYLEEPLEQIPLDFQLTSSAVEIDDELVMVGYGFTNVKPGDGIKRLFGRNTVTQKGRSNLTNMKDKDIVFLFERRGPQAFAGDSGGPCFREDGQGRWLVGLVSQGNGSVSRFTSLYPHLLWIKDQIARAEQLAEQQRKRKPL